MKKNYKTEWELDRGGAAASPTSQPCPAPCPTQLADSPAPGSDGSGPVAGPGQAVRSPVQARSPAGAWSSITAAISPQQTEVRGCCWDVSEMVAVSLGNFSFLFMQHEAGLDLCPEIRYSRARLAWSDLQGLDLLLLNPLHVSLWVYKMLGMTVEHFQRHQVYPGMPKDSRNPSPASLPCALLHACCLHGDTWQTLICLQIQRQHAETARESALAHILFGLFKVRSKTVR